LKQQQYCISLCDPSVRHRAQGALSGVSSRGALFPVRMDGWMDG
jgi:hypothetical protein